MNHFLAWKAKALCFHHCTEANIQNRARKPLADNLQKTDLASHTQNAINR